MVLFLPVVFAVYNLPRRKGSAQFIGISSLYFKVHYRKSQYEIPLNDLTRITLERRRKLAPLITGGVVTSLSLLSIILYSSGLEVVALLALGLILTYIGFQEYVVIHIEHSNNTRLLWLPLKVQLEKVRPFIAMLEYFVSKKYFPKIYALRPDLDNAFIVHSENKPVESSIPIYFSFRNIQSPEKEPIIINPVFLDTPISINGENEIIGSSNHLINQSALIETNSTSYT